MNTDAKTTPTPSWADEGYESGQEYWDNLREDIVFGSWGAGFGTVELILLHQKPPEIPEGYFVKNYGPLQGRNWLAGVSDEDKRALAQYANACSGYGIRGGRARALQADLQGLRDHRGRFLPKQ